MHELLPYYERELGFIKKYSREFSERFPKIAGRLLMVGEVCEDPHIERMIQSFALLNSRISKKLDDDYPELTEAIFEVLYPHYLRPFPSCSIAKFDCNAAAAQLTTTSKIARHTELQTRAVKGVACKFKTVYDVDIAPIQISKVKFEPIASVPESIILPSNATSSISITIETLSERMGITQLNVGFLRAFIDGEPSFCASLRDSLFMRSICAYIEVGETKKWILLKINPLSSVGFEEVDSLIPFNTRSQPAYRLLTEYFSFPEKFNFFDIDLKSISELIPSSCKSLTLHIVLSGLRSDSNIARGLGNLSEKNILLGCTPVINIFKQRGEPIRITHADADYPVVADARRAFAYDVHSIDSVKMVKQTPQGESVTQFRPFYSLQHGQNAEKNGHYWVARRNNELSSCSLGYETAISIVDIDFDPVVIETQTLSLELTCSNRDLPSLLGYGLPGGDLFLEGGSIISSINFMRKPSTSYRFENGRGTHWRLISHLSLNYLSLSSGGLEALQEMLNLYDLPRSATSQRQISGIVKMEHKAANAWLPGKPFACLVRGIEIRLTIEEENFTGSGVHVFATLLNIFFGLYVTTNSFTQLIFISSKTGEEILRCLPRSGNLNLV